MVDIMVSDFMNIVAQFNGTIIKTINNNFQSIEQIPTIPTIIHKKKFSLSIFASLKIEQILSISLLKKLSISV